MFGFPSNLRAVTTWLLLAATIGPVPVAAAQQPGTLATPSTAITLFEHIAALPQAAQQSDAQSSSGAASAPAKRHISKWVWIAIAAGAGVAIGVGVIAGNSQSGKTAVTAPTATIGAGSGGITAGAP